jgi:hypothetical protein
MAGVNRAEGAMDYLGGWLRGCLRSLDASLNP